MRWLRNFGSGVLSLVGRRRVDQELEEELRGFVEASAEEKRRRGMSAAEALQAARVEMGSIDVVKHRVWSARWEAAVDDFWQDLRYGMRVLRKSPGFTVVAVLTLGLGIGACTAVFSLVNAVLLRALPYRDVGRLVYLYTPDAHLKGVPPEAFGPAYADFTGIERESHSYTAMTQFAQKAYSLSALQGAEQVGGAKVDGAFFGALGAQPEMGRGITAADDAPGRDGVAVISHALWQTMFGGEADVLTKSLRLDGRAYRVVGVMPAEFGYPHDYDLVTGISSIRRTDVWVPRGLTPLEMTRPNDSSGYVVARLRAGVSAAQAQAEMAAIMTRLNRADQDRAHPDSTWTFGAYVKAFEANAMGGVRPLMWTLLGAVGLVLLIACGNAANLLLARAASRMHELGVRATLGAGRGRVVRQLLTESLLLGLGGGALGVGLAYGLVQALLRLNPGNIPRMDGASVDGRVLCFALMTALGTSLLFGIVPALSVARTSLVEFLKTGGNRGAVGERGRMQSALIVMQVALVVMLLAAAGLLLHSYVNVERVPTGFSSATVSIDVRLNGQYAQQSQRLEFFRTLIEKARQIPGVQAAGMISNLPLANSQDLSSLWVDGYANQKNQMVEWRGVSAQYFSAMTIPLVEGRFFTEEDTAGHPLVAVVNEAFAHTYFAGRTVVGNRIWDAGPEYPQRRAATIVGVVANVQGSSLETATAPEEFRSVWQADTPEGFVVIRTGLPESDVAAALRGIVRGIDPNLALGDVRTMGERVSEAGALRRFQTMLLTGFAGMALVLSAVGLYGLLAYGVKRRTAEIGVRIALGSSRGQVVRMVMHQGLRLVVLGLGIGLAGALGLTRLLAAWLFGVSPFDPVTFIGVPVLLLGVAVLAAVLPGWKAAGVDPMVALRCE